MATVGKPGICGPRTVNIQNNSTVHILNSKPQCFSTISCSYQIPTPSIPHPLSHIFAASSPLVPAWKVVSSCLCRCSVWGRMIVYQRYDSGLPWPSESYAALRVERIQGHITNVIHMLGSGSCRGLTFQ